MRPGSATYHEGAARLRPRQSSALRGRGGFPALCFLPSISSLFVSIPFIAGRWSLSLSMGRASPSMRAFQSPSLRGSGRFPWSPSSPRAITAGFNPLHCGAVVASEKLSEERVNVVQRFQSPSLQGSGRFTRTCKACACPWHVSIPFIAGQWSLPGGSASPRPTSPSFNPLHCGAVVASVRIAGLTSGAVVFQSPSLRGSGRFGNALKSPRFPRNRFNPLHCGAVVASRLRASEDQLLEERFNPLHCGAVVASQPRGATPNGGPRFNPLHCGAVVASGGTPGAIHKGRSFQSPSLRGSGRFMCGWCWTVIRLLRPVSIPFIAGQWSLPKGEHMNLTHTHVSIPFIAGQWSLRSRQEEACT